MRSAVHALCLLVVATLLSLGRPAFASHYAVGDVPHLITPADAEKLHKAGVTTTEDLLAKAGKTKDPQGARQGVGAQRRHLARPGATLRPATHQGRRLGDGAAAGGRRGQEHRRAGQEGLRLN